MILWPRKWHYRLHDVAEVHSIAVQQFLSLRSQSLKSLMVEFTIEDLYKFRSEHPDMIGTPTLYALFTEDEIKLKGSHRFAVKPIRMFIYPVPRVMMLAEVHFQPYPGIM